MVVMTVTNDGAGAAGVVQCLSSGCWYSMSLGVAHSLKEITTPPPPQKLWWREGSWIGAMLVSQLSCVTDVASWTPMPGLQSYS